MSFDHRFLKTYLDADSYAKVLDRLTPTEHTSQPWRIRMASVGLFGHEDF